MDDEKDKEESFNRQDADGDEEEKPRQSVAQAVKALEARNQFENQKDPSSSSIRSSKSRDSLGSQRNRTTSFNSNSKSNLSSTTSSPEFKSSRRLSTSNNAKEKGKEKDQSENENGNGKERAFDLCCLLQRSMDVVSGLAISKKVNLVLGRVLFDSLEEEMQSQSQLILEEEGSQKEDSRFDEDVEKSKTKGKEKESQEISSFQEIGLQKSKDFIRNGLSICVVAEEEAVFFALTHVS